MINPLPIYVHLLRIPYFRIQLAVSLVQLRLANSMIGSYFHMAKPRRYIEKDAYKNR